MEPLAEYLLFAELAVLKNKGRDVFRKQNYNNNIYKTPHE